MGRDVGRQADAVQVDPKWWGGGAGPEMAWGKERSGVGPMGEQGQTEAAGGRKQGQTEAWCGESGVGPKWRGAGGGGGRGGVGSGLKQRGGEGDGGPD